MIDQVDTHQELPRCIRRESLYDDVIQMYQVHLKEIQKEFPFRVEFYNESAVDTGGVCRNYSPAFGRKRI